MLKVERNILRKTMWVWGEGDKVRTRGSGGEENEHERKESSWKEVRKGDESERGD